MVFKNVKTRIPYICITFLIALFCARENPLFDPNANPHGIPVVSAGNDTIVSINDTIRLSGEVVDDGEIERYEWNINDEGFVEVSKIDTIIIAPKIPYQAYKCSLRVADDGGRFGVDTVTITILQDIPTAIAECNTHEASINDSIILNGSATDKYGYITKYEWDAGGTGTFVGGAIDDSIISVKTSNSPITSFDCILRVTDDDGNHGYDTVSVTVVLDPPVPMATCNSSEVYVNDSITLMGSASDKYGYIIKYEWDPGGTGNFIGGTLSDSIFKTKVSKYPDTIPYILRVTDDDSVQAYDTVMITILGDPPLLTMKSFPEVVSMNDAVTIKGYGNSAVGYVIKWEWDPGLTGTFIGGTTADSAYSTISPSTLDSSYYYALRATYNDGTIAHDTISIKAISDLPVPNISSNYSELSINDTVIFTGFGTDKFGSIVKWEWDPGATGTFISTNATNQFKTNVFSIPGIFVCILKATDDDNEASYDTVAVSVVLDAPIVTAKAKTNTVTLYNFFDVSGDVINKYGSIVKYEWNLNSTGYKETPTIETSFKATELSNVCSLRVTDDDNNVAYSSITVAAVNYQIIPVIGTENNKVSINDTVLLVGSVSTPQFDTIVKWEWDDGNTGSFITSVDSTYLFVAPSTPDSNFLCLLKVTDKNGFIGLDSIKINVLLDAPTCTAMTTTPTVFTNDTIRLHGIALDLYGTIEKYEWDFDGSGWIETSSGDTTIIAPQIEQFYFCNFRVTDDDDIVSSYKVKITTVHPTMTDIDGNVYNVIILGCQAWTVENLRTTKFNDNTAIPHVTDDSLWNNLATSRYCYHNNTTDEDSIAKFGALYNWFTVNTGKLAPVGWHVPSFNEWEELQEYLISSGYNWDGDTTGNKIGKSMATTTDWDSSGVDGHVGKILSSNNSCGFSGYPSGFRSDNGKFASIGKGCTWWSSTDWTPVYSWEGTLLYISSAFIISDMRKTYGASVRLIRD